MDIKKIPGMQINSDVIGLHNKSNALSNCYEVSFWKGSGSPKQISKSDYFIGCVLSQEMHRDYSRCFTFRGAHVGLGNFLLFSHILYHYVIPATLCWKECPVTPMNKRSVWKFSFSSKLETLQIYQEKYDPFKNSQIVLFVYITQGVNHWQCERGGVGSFPPTTIILSFLTINRTYNMIQWNYY